MVVVPLYASFKKRRHFLQVPHPASPTPFGRCLFSFSLHYNTVCPEVQQKNGRVWESFLEFFSNFASTEKDRLKISFEAVFSGFS
jgi:hypothetical protein